jgi:uncharacterized protein involved in exopolysaccharide biosynthesis
MNAPPVGASHLVMRLARYRWFLVLMPLLLALVVGVVSALAPPVYTAHARLLPPQTNTATASSLLGQIGGTAVLGASALTLKNPSDLYAALFYSRTVQDDVITQFKLAQHYDVSDRDDLRALVGKRTKVEVGRDGIINLAYTDTSANSAAAITNGMIQAMYRIAQQLAKGEAERRIEFYDGLILQNRQQLQEAITKLQKAEEETGLTRLQGQEEANTAATAEIKGMIASREVELKKMRVTATDQHPEIVRTQSELNALRAQLAQLGATGSTGSNQGARTPGKGLYFKVDQYAQMRAKVDPLRLEVEMNGNVLAQLIKARALSRVDESRDFSVISILDAAVAPTKKSGPRVYVNAIAAGLIGFFLALILALTWDLLFSDPARRARWHVALRSYRRGNSRQSS